MGDGISGDNNCHSSAGMASKRVTFKDETRHKGRQRSGASRLRRWLERRGPAGIKFGQFLAGRPDLIPQEYCDEFLRLVDQVPPFSWPDAKRILAHDLSQN